MPVAFVWVYLGMQVLFANPPASLGAAMSCGLPGKQEPGVKEHGCLVTAGLIVLAIAGDVLLNQSKVTLFLIQEIITLQEYLQFWR